MNHKKYLSSVFEQVGIKNVILCDNRRSGKTCNTLHWAKKEAEKGRTFAIVTVGPRQLEYNRKVLGDSNKNIFFYTQRNYLKHNQRVDTVIIDEQVDLDNFCRRNPGFACKNTICLISPDNTEYLHYLTSRLPVFHIYPHLNQTTYKSKL